MILGSSKQVVTSMGRHKIGEHARGMVPIWSNTRVLLILSGVAGQPGQKRNVLALVVHQPSCEPRTKVVRIHPLYLLVLSGDVVPVYLIGIVEKLYEFRTEAIAIGFRKVAVWVWWRRVIWNVRIFSLIM